MHTQTIYTETTLMHTYTDMHTLFTSTHMFTQYTCAHMFMKTNTFVLTKAHMFTVT